MSCCSSDHEDHSFSSSVARSGCGSWGGTSVAPWVSLEGSIWVFNFRTSVSSHWRRSLSCCSSSCSSWHPFRSCCELVPSPCCRYLWMERGFFITSAHNSYILSTVFLDSSRAVFVSSCSFLSCLLLALALVLRLLLGFALHPPGLDLPLASPCTWW